MLHHIRLTLARCADHPVGNPADGYELLAELDDDAHLHRDRTHTRGPFTVSRFRPGRPDRCGFLHHRPGGSDGATWAVEYLNGHGGIEPGFRWDAHQFVAGEYVSLRDAESEDLRTFRVDLVHPADEETDWALANVRRLFRDPDPSVSQADASP